MADWQTISSLATAGGTLVLAMATFSAVRSSNRSARIAEQALLTGMRPLLVPSLGDDPAQKVLWSDRHAVRLDGGRAIFEEANGVIYLAIGLRNVGTGLALLHGWYPMPDRAFVNEPHADVDDFRRLSIDLYIPAGGSGYWEGAIRDADDPLRAGLPTALADREPFTIDLLYGDQEGGQRTISRFTVLPAGDDGWYCQAGTPLEPRPPRPPLGAGRCSERATAGSDPSRPGRARPPPSSSGPRRDRYGRNRSPSGTSSFAGRRRLEPHASP